MQEENKKQKFERLANARISKALKQLDLIGNLANNNAYDYSKDDVDKVITALDDKIKELKLKFSRGLVDKQHKDTPTILFS